jgi:hypothetical protein
MLQEQLATEQESSTALVNQVNELKSMTEKTEKELEEYKRAQLESFNNLRKLCMQISSSGNSHSSTPAA